MNASRREGMALAWQRSGRPVVVGSRRLTPRPRVFLMYLLGKQSTEGDGGAEVAEGGGW